jgi:hypothetical protein
MSLKTNIFLNDIFVDDLSFNALFR